MLTDENVSESAGVYRAKIPFGRHFDRVARDTENKVEQASCVTSPLPTSGAVLADFRHATGTPLEPTAVKHSRF